MPTLPAHAETTAPPVGGTDLAGIGGWLMLLAIREVLGLFLFTMAMIGNFSQLPPGTAALQPLAMFGALLIEGSLLLLLVFTAFLLFSKSRRFPRIFIVSSVAGLLEPLVLAWWLAATAGADTLAHVTHSVTVQYLGSIVGGILCIAYVSRSVRVRNTFVN